MFYHQPQFVHVLRITVAALVTALCLLFVMSGNVKADEYTDSLGMSPSYGRTNGLNPAPGQPDYNRYQRQQEALDNQLRDLENKNRYRYAPPPPANPNTNSLGWTAPSVTIMPDGKAFTCLPATKGYSTNTCY